MAVIDLTAETFESTLQDNDIVLIDFWAPWCAPCRSFAPIYAQVSDRHPDIVFAKVDTEQEQALAGHFQIRSIPTVMLVREQVILVAQPGMLPESALEELIGKARDLDMDEVRRQIAETEAAPA